MKLLAPDAGFDATRFVSSWVLSPTALFVVRSLLSFYAFFTRFFVLAWEQNREQNREQPAVAHHDFSYFTTLSFWGLAFYFAFAALHTGSYAFRRIHVPFLARWPAALQYLHSLFYSTIAVYPFIVTIVFWAIIFDGTFLSKEERWSNVSQHALNAVFALFEIIVPRTAPLPWLHLLWLIIILALYLGIAYITYADAHFYVYNFLNDHKHSRGVVAGYIFGILAMCVVLFVVIRYVIWLRKWVTEVKMGKAGKTYPSAGAEEYPTSKETERAKDPVSQV